MPPTTASSTTLTDVHVRLLYEGVDVWRPVKARPLSEHVFCLSGEPVPADEVWVFQPGDAVIVERRTSDGTDILIAVAGAVDLDGRSSVWLEEVGRGRVQPTSPRAILQP